MLRSVDRGFWSVGGRTRAACVTPAWGKRSDLPVEQSGSQDGDGPCSVQLDLGLREVNPVAGPACLRVASAAVSSKGHGPG
jgi:hypothetical protein